MKVDCIVTPSTQYKGQLLVGAAYDGAKLAGLDARVVLDGNVREGALVVLYGLGGFDRIKYLGNPNVVSFDAGYWERKLDIPARKYRVSIGGFHCPNRIMIGKSPGGDRWLDSGFEIFDRPIDEAGPVVLIGNGPKSNRVLSSDWAAKKAEEIRALDDGRAIRYRPKPKRPHDPGVDYDELSTNCSVEDSLRHASLVVCRHSNVAIDACRLGVPVVCEDGAAAAIYPSRLADESQQPDIWLRTEFLHRIAWWQWSMDEMRAGLFWPWLLKKLEDV